MKRKSLLIFVTMFVFTFVLHAGSDRNAMDEIGFDKTFGYYSSGNEIINMQSGNLTLDVVVSPAFLGPQGSGMDLQLKLYYNSQIWRYKGVDTDMPAHIPPNCANIEEPDILDLEHMYYSPVGLGWTLHMGRLMRKVTQFGKVSDPDSGCEAIQFFFEDSSGAVHEFGPYCDNECSGSCSFTSIDGSNMRLNVTDFNGPNESIELYYNSGKKMVFGPGLAPPILLNDCTGLVSNYVSADPDERVYYVTEIHDYKSLNTIEVNYDLTYDLYDRYYAHQITSIKDCFDRVITFEYSPLDLAGKVAVPQLDRIWMYGYKGVEVEYIFNHNIDDIVEPWGLAQCHIIEGGLSLQYQLFLASVNLPEGLSHSFSYADTGEISNYTSPLNATTSYHFKDVITESQGAIPALGCPNDIQKRIYMNPSRFLWKKEVNANDQHYEWLFAVGTSKTRLTAYDGEAIQFHYYNSYGGVKPVTGMIDPEENETRYHWVAARFEADDPDGKPFYFYSPYSSMYPSGYLPDPYQDFPKEDNAKNGRLEQVCYYEGNLDNRRLLKEELFTYTEGIERSEYCHENDQIHRMHIRMESKTIKNYDATGACVTNSEAFEYDDDTGNLIIITQSAESLPDLVTVRQYKDPTTVPNGYKYDFLQSEIVYCNGQVVSAFGNIEDENTGKIKSQHKVTRWSENPQEIEELVTHYGYNSKGELIQKQTEHEPVFEYGYKAGSLEYSKEGGLLFQDNEIDVHTGLIEIQRDSAGRATAYEYDKLNRVTKIDPPGDVRYPIQIDYSKPAYGLNIQYFKVDSNGIVLPLQFHWIDALGNHSTQQNLTFHDETLSYNVVKDVSFDWRGLPKRSVYPDSGNGVRNVYDALGRPVTVYEEKTDPPTVTDVEYSVIEDDNIKGFRKKIARGGIEKFYFSDSRGNLREVQQPGGPVSLASYEYDDLGNLTRVFQDATTRVFNYNLLNQLESWSEPETDNTLTILEYHADGKLRMKNTPEGTIHYFYDEHSRLREVRDSQGVTIREYLYGDITSSIEFDDGTLFEVENGYGRLASIIESQDDDVEYEGVVQTAFSYNEFGEVIAEAVCIKLTNGSPAPKTYITRYEYNEWGSLDCIKYPVSETWIRYSNDFGDTADDYTIPFTTSIDFFDPTYPDKIRTIVPRIEYNATNGLKRLDYENAVSLTFDRDIAHRISRVHAFNSMNTNDDYFENQYGYDGLDRLTVIGTKSYSYNNDGSLRSIIDTDLKNPVPNTTYQYDPRGNMISRTVEGNPGLSFSGYSFPNNRLQTNGDVIAEYDLNGNLKRYKQIGLNLSESVYFYSPENRMNSALKMPQTRFDFYYDGNGQRRLKYGPGQAELFFFDPSGNNLLEKLTYDMADPYQPIMQKDECYINFAGKTVAQFDYLEPVSEIKFRNNKQSVFYPGDMFDLFLDYQYEGPTQENVWHFAVLAVHGSYYFLPNGDPTPENLEPTILRHGRNQLQIIEPFPMPESLDDVDGLYIISMLATSYENNEPRQFGNIAMREFKLRSARPNFYVRNSPTNGKGTIEDPFNSIEAAIAAVPIGEHSTIKLFPGVYQLENEAGLTLDGLDLDIIGSGQARTTIRGLNPLVTKMEFLNGDYVLQGLTNETNLECGSSSMEIRNVCLLSQGAYEGITAYGNSFLRVKNTLISGYLGGITLADSDAVIRNCTIDSCWGNYGFEFAGIYSTSSGTPQSLIIEESIITNNQYGVRTDNNINVEIYYSNIWNQEAIGPDANGNPVNGVNFDIPAPCSIVECISLDPLFVQGPDYPGRDHVYYLSAISAGQAADSPCIDAGFPMYSIDRIVNGTTRTDGMVDICRQDMGYHGEAFGEIVGIANLNNDEYELNDPKRILKGDSTDMTKNYITAPDPSALLGIGPLDFMMIQEKPDGSLVFQSYIQEDCGYIQQPNPDSPTGVIDASLNDMDGDGSKDLVVLEESGPTFFINDTAGSMVRDTSMNKSYCHAIETLDANGDGVMDVLIAGNYGISVEIANDYLDFTVTQVVNSGNTNDMLLYDFDKDLDKDLVTINMDGSIQFFRNDQGDGFIEAGTPIEAGITGKLGLMDANNNGSMDITIEIEPGVTKSLEIGDAFGAQMQPVSGKRAIKYALFDHLGTTKMLTNNWGTVTWPHPVRKTNKLLPFGKDLDLYPDTPDPVQEAYKLTLTGKELDKSLNLHYFGARYYNASLPRFMSPDPVGGKTENPISWNRYLYCRNNPINCMDPDGQTTYVKEGSDGELYIMEVVDDGKTAIIACPYDEDGNRLPGPGRYIGESLAVDSFISPDTGDSVGIVYSGQSIQSHFYSLALKASLYGKDKTFAKSTPGGEFDVKSNYPGHEGKSYHGFLFHGKYVTLRELGNILAGFNAAQFEMEFDDFQKGAGALHKHGLIGIGLQKTFGLTFGDHPTYGENNYQYSRSKYGYELFKSNPNPW